jgi:ABC-type glycerol-3-phosphate transport system permease component
MAIIEKTQTSRFSSQSYRTGVGKIAAYVLLTLASSLFLFPTVYLLNTALKQPGTEMLWPPTFFKFPLHWENFSRVFTLVPFGRYLVNSIFITVVATFGSVLSASMAAFAFARLPFRGRNVLFWLMLFTMMVPFQVLLIPQFLLFTRLGWIGSYLPVILPPFFGGGAWAIFMLRQFFIGLPQDLIDAAEVDGASPWQIYWRVILPLSRPALAAVTVIFFMNYWNDFLGPLVFLRQQELLTIPVGIAAFHSAGLYLQGAWAVLMAATAISVLPLLIIFLFTQQYFVQGIARSGLKG